MGPYATAHSSDSTAACSRTVSVAFSCLSGGSVLAKDPLHLHPQLRLDVLPDRPVDGDILAYVDDQLPGDLLQCLLSQDFHRAVVGLQSIVERQLVLAQAQV